jgi:hypothetical protein
MHLRPTEHSPMIKVSTTAVRYLGVFFDPHLAWTHHCMVMANRVRSSVKALRVAGNSVRGLSHGIWRRVWSSTLSPTLFYGMEVWYHPKRQAAIRILQSGQDEFCRHMAGTFRTAPAKLNMRLVGIPPVKFHLTKLSDRAAACVSHLPQWSLLRRPEAARKSTFLPRHAPVTTVI